MIFCDSTAKNVEITLLKMLPAIWALARTYAPWITLPFAAVVGFIGYNFESILSDKYTPYKPSIEEQRDERQLKELNELMSAKIPSFPGVDKLEDKKFVPKSIFEKNLSPQLVREKS